MLKFGSKSDITSSYKCTVRLLDDTEVLECEFQPQHKGDYLLDYVCKQLNLIEKDYFGLRFVDNAKQRHWLDLGKTIVKQIKDLDPILFSFRVKFYPQDPLLLKEEITKYQVFLQLKRDLLHGRLYCAQNDAALLGAYIVQAELGDYDSEIHEGNYISELKLLLKQTPLIEEKIMELHKTQLKGHSPIQIETFFLKKACQLDTYGVDPHPVKDHKGTTLYLGINYQGLLTFQGSKKTKHFTWSEIQKINYEGKMFIIHLVYYEDSRTKKKHTVGFKCPTAAACRYVWRCAVEQMLFFTLQKSADAPVLTGGGLFSWGTKFKYSGRTEKEILHESRYLRHQESSGSQTGSLKRKASSVPATPSTPMGSDLGEIRYSSLPRSSHSVPDSRLNPEQTLFLGDSPENPLSLLETVSEDQEHGVGKVRLQDVEVEGVGQRDKLVLPLGNGFGVNVGEGMKDASGTDDYYFRDSFDRSSCDSQLQDTFYKATLTPSHRSSRSHSPQPPYRLKAGGSRTSLQTFSSIQTSSIPPYVDPTTDTRMGQNVQVDRFNVCQVFIPSFLFVAISLITATVLILESDSDLLSNVRGLPEMITLKKQYYEPIKEFFTKRLFKLLPK